MQLLIALAALAAGAANPFQSATNSSLSQHLQRSLWSALWVYLSGMAGVVLLLLLLRQPPPPVSAIQGAPWWAFTGGLISIGATFAGLTLAYRLGAGTFTGLSITASVVVSLLLDQMGWLGFRQHSLSTGRIAGALLMVIGIWLLSRF